MLLLGCRPQPQASAPSILYFTTRTDAQPSQLAPGRLQVALGAQPVGEWGDLMLLHAAQPAKAILLDGAELAGVDAADVQALYRQCVLLGFFNVYAPQVAELLADASIAADGWMDGSQPYPGDFYIMVLRSASGSLGDCPGGDTAPDATGGLAKSRSQGPLSTPAELDAWVQILTQQLTQP